VDVSFPTDPYLVPFLLPQEAANPTEGKITSRVTADILKNARDIVDPAERSLALRQIANGAIAGNQMILAHHVLEDAISASSEVTIPLVRDQRLIGLVVSLNALSDGLLRMGRENRGMIATAEEAEAAGIDALPKSPESTVLIRMARLEWRRAVYLASLINNPTYRNEMLYRIAEDEAVGSSTISVDFPLAVSLESMGNRPSPTRVPGAGPNPPVPPRPPAASPPRSAPERAPAPVRPPNPLGTRPPANLAREALAAPPDAPADRKMDEDFVRLGDEVLVDAWNVANQIDRLIWKNRAMVRIALSASDSGQYRRGVELSRTIENAESRSEALLLMAEAICRTGQGQQEDATAAYQATAEAVASIPQAGLRGVMVGFLIDSLISSGRFDDARACSAIYPEESERFVALGAIAEAQGRRGLAESARRWIAAEAPEAYRSALYRRVSTGVLWSIENQRSKEMDIGAEPAPAAR
jgi:hypothetical protein